MCIRVEVWENFVNEKEANAVTAPPVERDVNSYASSTGTTSRVGSGMVAATMVLLLGAGASSEPRYVFIEGYWR